MFYKSLLMILLLGAATPNSVSQNPDQNDLILPSMDLRKQDVSEAFILINSKQVQNLEKSIKNILSRLTQPMKEPIILRSTSSGKDNLQRTIRQISESIRNKVMEFAQACGLASSVRKYKQTSKNVTVCKDWFSETLLQGSQMFVDFASMNEEIWTSIDEYFNERNVTSDQNKLPPEYRKTGFQFLGAVNEVTDYSEKLSQCLVKMTDRKKSEKYFDFKRVFLRMAKGSPKSVVKILRTSLDSTSFDVSSKYYATANRLHVFLCLSITNNEVSYNNCIRELQQLDKCVYSSKLRSDNKFNNHEIKPWLRAIQDLSDCKIQLLENERASVSCDMRRAMPKRIHQKVRYVYERILNRKLAKRSPLYGTANELAEILSRSAWGEEFVNELCQYCIIYEDGRRKLDKLSKTAHGNKKSLARYRKLSKSLEVYKKGILIRTFSAINKIHRTAHDFEKYLVGGIKIALNETWQSHMKILSAMTDWMVKLLELYSGEDMSEKITGPNPQIETPSPPKESDESIVWPSDESFHDYDEGNELRPFTAPRSRDDMMKDLDISTKNLIQSMNRVSRFRSSNDKSMIGCLANNLLLVAMFMETIGFISTLFCLGYGDKSEASSIELEEDWRSGRNRRSPLFLDYQEDGDTTSENKSPSGIIIYGNIKIQGGNVEDWSINEELLRISNYSENVKIFANVIKNK